MPNRYVREDAITSKAVNSLSWQGEVFWRRLLNRADDFGRFTADSELLRTEIFPRQLEKVRETDISRLLAECEKAGLLYVYSANSKPYLVLNQWEKGRAKHSKYPEPPPEIIERMQTYVYTCTHMSPTPIPTPTPGSPPIAGEKPFPEIPTEAEVIAMTMTAGIPEDFTKYVYADWFSRGGRDAAGNLIDWLPYVTKRWAREQVQWKNGKHRGKNDSKTNRPSCRDRNAGTANATNKSDYASKVRKVPSVART